MEKGETQKEPSEKRILMDWEREAGKKSERPQKVLCGAREEEKIPVEKYVVTPFSLGTGGAKTEPWGNYAS